MTLNAVIEFLPRANYYICYNFRDVLVKTIGRKAPWLLPTQVGAQQSV